MQQIIRTYLYSAGSLLLALAAVFLLANLRGGPTDFVPARDLVFNLPLTTLYWILAGVLFLVALLCLFGRRATLQLSIVLWVAVNLIIYQIGLHSMGATGGVRGYLGGVNDVFGLSASAMAGLLAIAVGYLLIGSPAALGLAWASGKIESIDRAKLFIKTACARCGGHIEFFAEDLGQTISCPHCRKDTKLRKPGEFLKIDCFFCKEHIEFPAHALGKIIPCPHCNKHIALREPARIQS